MEPQRNRQPCSALFCSMAGLHRDLAFARCLRKEAASSDHLPATSPAMTTSLAMPWLHQLGVCAFLAASCHPVRWQPGSNSSGTSSSGKFQPSWHFEPRNQIQLRRCSRCCPPVNRHRFAICSMIAAATGGGDAAVSCSWPNKQEYWCVLRCAIPTHQRPEEAAMHARSLCTNLAEHPTPCTNTPTVLCREIWKSWRHTRGHHSDEIRGSGSRAMRQESPS